MFDEQFLKKVKEHERRWREEYTRRHGEKEFKATTFSGIPIKPVYTPTDIDDIDYDEIAMPGEFPYTRGAYPLVHQAHRWATQFPQGLALPETTRERYELLRKQGLEGYPGMEPPLFVGTDMPSMLGYDPDHPLSKGRIGITMPNLCTVKEMETLASGLPLDKINYICAAFDTIMINLGQYVVVAEEQGIPREKLYGTCINYWYRQMYMEQPSFRAESTLRFNTDLVKYCTEHMPNFNTMSFSFWDIIECGGNSVQELAFMLSAIIAISESCVNAGIDPDRFLPRFAFHLSAHNDFFESIASIRALRKMWAKIARDRFGCKNPRAMKAIMQIHTAGSTFTRQQPLNNLIRGSIQTLAAILAGGNSIWTVHFDDALAAPTAQAQILGLRTQQIIRYETGVPNVSDPLAGSYYLEWLTDKVEEEATALLKKIEGMGGWTKCVETGWYRREIELEANKWRESVDKGETTVVGVNKFVEDEEEQKIPVQQYEDVEKIVIERIQRFREERDTAKTNEALARLREAAERVEGGELEGKLVPAAIEAVKAKATLGEMMDIFKETFGWVMY